MKNICKFLTIGSAVAAVGTAALVAVAKIKRDLKKDESSDEAELAETQLKQDAEMAELRNEEDKIEKEHKTRMNDIQKSHMETMAEIEKIHEEFLTNMELCKTATPEEAKKLYERNEELLKELTEIRM